MDNFYFLAQALIKASLRAVNLLMALLIKAFYFI